MANEACLGRAVSFSSARDVSWSGPVRTLVFWLNALMCTGLAAEEAEIRTTPLTALRDEAMRYESGDATVRDAVRAAQLYCDAARQGDAVSQFNLGWMYVDGRGVERNDGYAAFLFSAAAKGGVVQAQHMLALVSGEGLQMPSCMSDMNRSQPYAEVATKPWTPKPLSARPPRRINVLVRSLAPKYSVSPELVLAIMAVESNFDAAAISRKSAVGLMQLIPETATRFDIKDLHDPEQNIRGGLAYLRWLLAYFEGDLSLVAAAYNAGEGAVDRYGGIPPYAETRKYVVRVLLAVGSSVHPFDSRVTQPSKRLQALRSGGVLR